MVFESEFSEFNFGKLILNPMFIDWDFDLGTSRVYTENEGKNQLWFVLFFDNGLLFKHSRKVEAPLTVSGYRLLGSHTH